MTGTGWGNRALIRAAFDNCAAGPADVEALQHAVSTAVTNVLAAARLRPVSHR